MPDDRGSNSAAASPTFLGRLTNVLGVVGAALPLLSIVIYLMVRSGYDGFYGSFGVTPEEAGVGQAEMVGHAALALGYITLALLALLVFIIPWLVPVRRSSDWRAYLFVTLILFIVGFLLSLREQVQIGLGSALGFISMSYFFRTAYLLTRYNMERQDARRHLNLGRRFRQSGFVAPLLSLLLVFAVIAAVEVEGQFSRTGGDTMERAARGEHLTPAWFSFVVSPRVRPVDVIWLGDVSAPDELKTLDRPLYLGQANGMGIFFDWRRDQTVRLPAGTFALCTTLPTEAHTGVGARECPSSRLPAPAHR